MRLRGDDRLVLAFRGMERMKKNLLKALCFFCLVGGALCLSAGENRAARERPRLQIPEGMPKVRDVAESELAGYADRFVYEREDDKGVSFTIYVPKGWEQSETVYKESFENRGRNVLAEIARFYGPPIVDKRSFITISTVSPSRDVTAPHWLLNHIITNGYLLVGYRPLEEDVAEALYAGVHRDTSFIVRSKIQRDGERLVLVQYWVPDSFWEREKTLQAAAVRSFEIRDPRPYTAFAQLDSYRYLDYMLFSYPPGWKFGKAYIESPDQFGTNIVNMASSIAGAGWVSANIVSRDPTKPADLPEEMKLIDKIVADNDFKVRDMIEEVTTFDLHPFFSYGRVEAFYASPNKDPSVEYEVWVAFSQSLEFYSFFILFTPSRNEDFLSWAVNTRVLEHMVETQKPVADIYIPEGR